MADAKLSALTGVSVPAVADLLYLVDVSDTTDDAAGSSRSVTLERLLGLLTSQVGGRLTTESGVGVSTSDRTSQSTLYYTPFAHDRTALYDGTRWKLYVFTERSLSLSSLTSGKNYDVFLYDNSGTLTLELSAAWTDDTTRADALTTQDGVLVKSGATTRRYLGTIRTTGTTTTEDSLTKRFVWNLYNRMLRSCRYFDTTNHTYSTTSWRYWNNDSAAKCSFVAGLGGLGCAVGLNIWSDTGDVIASAAPNATDGDATDAASGRTVGTRTGATVGTVARLGLNDVNAVEFGLGGTADRITVSAALEM